MKANCLILLIFILSVGCAPQEKITPIFENEEIVNSITREFSGPNDAPKLFYVRGKYYFEDMDVDRPVDSNVSFVDSILNNIFSIIVRIGGNFEVVSDPIPLDLSDLDTDVVKELFVYKIDLSIVEPEKTKANLKFMKEVVIKLVDENDQEKELVAINFRLKDEENYELSKACDFKCLQIPVSKENLLNFIGTSKKVMVVPIIKLGSAPKDNFAVKGSMRFKVGLKLDL